MGFYQKILHESGFFEKSKSVHVVPEKKMRYNRHLCTGMCLQVFGMDVFKKLILIPLSFLALACGQKGPATHVLFFTGDTSCKSYLVQKEYLVSWENGDITVEKSVNEKAFVENFLKNHENEIISSEPHYHLSRRYDFEEAYAYGETGRLHESGLQESGLQESGHNHPAFQPKDNQKNLNPFLNWGQKSIGTNALLKHNIDSEDFKEVIISIIDSGMDRTSPELQGVIAINEKEKINGLDDDNNGVPDDVFGVDWLSDEPHEITKDYTGHGTHLAGVIAARHDVGTIQGIAPHVKILPQAFMNKNRSGLVKIAVQALRYASQRGAKIINASWGDSLACSNILKKEINHLAEKNILFVTAAGNDGHDLNDSPMFPASFGLSNVIVVGASTLEGKMASFSNYGSLVDIVAPGTNIISTYPLEYDNDGHPDGLYSRNGTSSAVAFVSAAAALLWSKRPDASYFEVKQALLEGSKPGPYPVNTGGHLHIPGALEAFRL